MPDLTLSQLHLYPVTVTMLFFVRVLSFESLVLRPLLRYVVFAVIIADLVGVVCAFEMILLFTKAILKKI